MMTVYHEFSKQLSESERGEIIRNGWGSVVPVKPVPGRTGTRVQVVELSAAEYEAWKAAQARAIASVWAGFGGRRNG